jgi:hypothetical protein
MEGKMKTNVEKLVEQWENVVGFARQMKDLATTALQNAVSEDSRTFYNALFNQYETQEKCAQGGLDLYHEKYANMPLQPVYVLPRKVA